jgi:Recombinase/Recombinase zinc beta ribbon domain
VPCADEQVRHAIGRVFELWRRLGSARQVVKELIAENQKLPRRTVGSRRVRWVRASYGAVHDLLTNPAYAGAFVFGRTRQQKQLDEHGRVRRRTVQLPIEEWSVCIPEHHPGYVSWSEHLETRERLRSNVIKPREGGGAAREGGGLLQGLVRCRHCGRRMQVAYSGTSGRVPRYACVRAHHLHGTDHYCQSVGGWSGRSRPHSSRPSRRPGSERRRRRSRSSSASTTSDSPGSGSRSSAPSLKQAAPGASSTPASPSTDSSPARSKPGSRPRGRSSSASAASSPSSSAADRSR